MSTIRIQYRLGSAIIAAFLCLISFAVAAEDPKSLGLPPYIGKMLEGDGSLSVSVPVRGSVAVLTLGRRFGGAAVSFTYRGQQYVNNDSGREVNYGRQMQSAVTFDGLGECFNPTEAGGKYDRGKPSSSSRLMSWRATDRTLESKTDMAFWMAPGDRHQLPGCGGTWEGNIAQNTAKLDGYLLSKAITLGEPIANAMRYDTTFHIPSRKKSGRFVPVVIHLPQVFSAIYTWSPEEGLRETDRGNGRGQRVFIVSTKDGAHAMAIYSPARNGAFFYGFKKWPNTTVTRVVFERELDAISDHRFENFIIFGTLKEVADGLSHL